MPNNHKGAFSILWMIYPIDHIEFAFNTMRASWICAIGNIGSTKKQSPGHDEAPVVYTFFIWDYSLRS